MFAIELKDKPHLRVIRDIQGNRDWEWAQGRGAEALVACSAGGKPNVVTYQGSP